MLNDGSSGRDARLYKLRHKEILDIMRLDHAASVRDLARKIGVSESTIRRDLDDLQAQNLIQRVHGGAILDIDTTSEPPFETREITNSDEKTLIGQLAAETVKDGEVIFLDGGTTTQFIVPFLAGRRGLTVVTCGLNICTALTKLPEIHTVGIGGEVHAGSQSFAGVMALEALRIYGIRCDRAFVSAGGVSAEHGATNRILDRIPLKRRVMEISAFVALVADSSKLGVVTLGHIAPITEFDLVVTDGAQNRDELEKIAAQGVALKMPV